MSAGPRRPRSERGVVTAELAMALPMLVAVTIGLVWLLAAGAAQVRMVDAARETARAVARGEPEAEAIELGLRVAPEGATIVVSGDDPVVVTATGVVDAPGGMFGFLPGLPLRAESVAARESAP